MPKKAKTPEEIADFRARVAKAATRLFLEHGPANVTMRQIAAEVGVSFMTPYRYFANKDEILATVRAEAFDRFAATLERAFNKGTDARDKSRRVGEAYLRFAKREPDTYQLMFAFSQPDEAQYPELVAANARARRSMVAYVEDLGAEGLIEGEPRLVGYIFWAAMHGIVVLDLAGALERGIDAKTLRPAMFRTLYAGLRALSAKAAAPIAAAPKARSGKSRASAKA